MNTTTQTQPKPLSYYINSPRLEELLGSNFGKITSRYGLKELLTFTARWHFCSSGGPNTVNHPDSLKIAFAICNLTDSEKLALMKAIIDHIEHELRKPQQ